jgi:NADPH:quinone reductase-like Zn-dependent oxidoreductase
MQIANQIRAVPIAITRHAAKKDDLLAAGVRLGALRPAIGKVFALDDIVEAHRHLEKGLHAGKKIVVAV